MKLTDPAGLTLHATLDGSAEKVTGPPCAVAWTVYARPYVGLLGELVKAMDCDAFTTANDCAFVAAL
jgi:hypothetical protein